MVLPSFHSWHWQIEAFLTLQIKLGIAPCRFSGWQLEKLGGETQLERRRAIETHGMIQTLAIELQASSGPFEDQDSNLPLWIEWLRDLQQQMKCTKTGCTTNGGWPSMPQGFGRVICGCLSSGMDLSYLFGSHAAAHLYSVVSRSFMIIPDRFSALLGAITSSVWANQSGFTFGCPNRHQQYRRVQDGSGVDEKKQTASDWSCFVLKRRTFHFRTPCITPCPAIWFS